MRYRVYGTIFNVYEFFWHSKLFTKQQAKVGNCTAKLGVKNDNIV